MRTRLLGRTGLDVSIVSLGGAAIGQQYGPISLSEAAATVHTAIDHGINLIDTSAFYGEGESERILGEVLRGGYRERVAICTKAGRHTRTHFDFTAKGLRTCFEGSLRRLQTDHVEILLAHDIEFADNFEQVFTETAEVLHQLKSEGKARFIGMSCLPLDLLRLAIERCQLDVVISYCQFNLQNNRLLSELVPVAEQHGVGILNASPLAMGLLTNQGPPPWHPADDEIKTTCGAAATYCRERGADIATLGMQFCYAETRIPSTITGTARQSELLENLKVLDQSPNRELLGDVEHILRPIHNRTWSSGKWDSQPK